MKAEQGMRYEILDQGGAAAKSAFGSIAEVSRRPARAGDDASHPHRKRRLPTNSCCHVGSALSLVVLMICAPATALARQGALGVILGISAQALLAMSCPGSASPCSTSCAVADLNPPMRVWQLFGGAV